MELWIRSQDKRKLCNCKSFSIRNIGDYAIFDDKDENIGQYRLEKRCLEILDEIQSILTKCILVFTGLGIEGMEEVKDFETSMNNNGIICVPNEVNIEQLNGQDGFVYQMPEK